MCFWVTSLALIKTDVFWLTSVFMYLCIITTLSYSFYLLPLHLSLPVLLLLFSLSLSLPQTAVSQEGQSEQFCAQCVQPPEYPHWLPCAPITGHPIQRERHPPTPLPAPARPASPGPSGRRDHPEETGPLQDLGPVQEHVWEQTWVITSLWLFGTTDKCRFNNAAEHKYIKHVSTRVNEPGIWSSCLLIGGKRETLETFLIILLGFD